MVHDSSFANVICDGAPRFGGNVIVHGPAIVASVVKLACGRVRKGKDVGRRKTTNTDSRSARCRGTVVRPSAMLNSAGSRFPLSACQSSASLLFTRKRT